MSKLRRMWTSFKKLGKNTVAPSSDQLSLTATDVKCSSETNNRPTISDSSARDKVLIPLYEPQPSTSTALNSSEIPLINNGANEETAVFNLISRKKINLLNSIKLAAEYSMLYGEDFDTQAHNPHQYIIVEPVTESKESFPAMSRSEYRGKTIIGKKVPVKNSSCQMSSTAKEKVMMSNIAEKRVVENSVSVKSSQEKEMVVAIFQNNNRTKDAALPHSPLQRFAVDGEDDFTTSRQNRELIVFHPNASSQDAAMTSGSSHVSDSSAANRALVIQHLVERVQTEEFSAAVLVHFLQQSGPGTSQMADIYAAATYRLIQFNLHQEKRFQMSPLGSHTVNPLYNRSTVALPLQSPSIQQMQNWSNNNESPQRRDPNKRMNPEIKKPYM